MIDDNGRFRDRDDVETEIEFVEYVRRARNAKRDAALLGVVVGFVLLVLITGAL